MHRNTKPRQLPSSSDSCHFSAWIRNKKTGVLGCCMLPCLRWKCQGCRERLKKRWGAHLQSMFEEWGKRLWRTVIPAERWSAVHRKLNRAGALYARIRRGDTNILYSTVPINEGSVKLSASDAVQLMRRDVKAIEETRRPISTERHHWALEESEPPKAEIIVKGRATKEAVKAAADQQGISVKEWKPVDDGWVAWGVSLPQSAGWDVETLHAFIASAELIQRIGPCPTYPIKPEIPQESKSDRPETSPTGDTRGDARRSLTRIPERATVLRV